MGLLTAILTTLLLFSCSRPPETSSLPILPEEKTGDKSPNRILYLIENNRIHEAIEALLDEKSINSLLAGNPLLENLCFQLIQKGLFSPVADDQISSLVAIRLCQNERFIPLLSSLLQNAVKNDNLDLSLATLLTLATFDSQEAKEAVTIALKSNYLLVRFEALFILCQKKHPDAYEQIEALMYKSIDEARPFFARLFALDNSDRSEKMIKNMLVDHDLKTRLEAILHAPQFDSRDLQQAVRMTFSDPSPQILEAASLAACQYQDQKMRTELEYAASRGSLAAVYALYTLGQQELQEPIFEAASKKNLQAIHLLSKMPHSESLLHSLCQDVSIEVRVNAVAALLEKKDPFVVPELFQLLQSLPDENALYLSGYPLPFIRVITSPHENPELIEVTNQLAQSLLFKAAELPEKEFLTLARMIFDADLRRYIAPIMRILENMRTEKAHLLLQEAARRLGSPFIRSWAALTLYKIEKDEQYEQVLHEMLKKNLLTPLFSTRPHVSWHLRQDVYSAHSLSLQETQELLVECWQTLGLRRDSETVMLFLKALQNGHEKNRAILAGLLLHSTA